MFASRQTVGALLGTLRLLWPTCSTLLDNPMSPFVASRTDARPAIDFASSPSRLRLPAPPCAFGAFAASGGVATGSEVADFLRPWVDQPISLVAHWIVARKVITLAWRNDTLLPLFQFDFARRCVRAGIEPVISELSGAMDDAEVALWFAQPNVWLAGATPADAFATVAAEVFDAARADRFVIRG